MQYLGKPLVFEDPLKSKGAGYLMVCEGFIKGQSFFLQSPTVLQQLCEEYKNVSDSRHRLCI